MAEKKSSKKSKKKVKKDNSKPKKEKIEEKGASESQVKKKVGSIEKKDSTKALLKNKTNSTEKNSPSKPDKKSKKIFSESLFFLGFIFLIMSYLKSSLYFMIAGIVLVFLSVIFHRISHKKEPEDKEQKKEMVIKKDEKKVAQKEIKEPKKIIAPDKSPNIKSRLNSLKDILGSPKTQKVLFITGAVLLVIAIFLSNWIILLTGGVLVMAGSLLHNLLKSANKIRLTNDPELNKLIKAEERTREEILQEKKILSQLEKLKRRENNIKRKQLARIRKQEDAQRRVEESRARKLKTEKRKIEMLQEQKKKLIEKRDKLKNSKFEMITINGMKKKMENGNKFSTGLDNMLNIVNNYSKVKVSDIAKVLSVSEKNAEEWATILEKHGLVKVKYYALGSPEIIKIKNEKGK